MAFNRKEIDALGGLEQEHLEKLKIVHEVTEFEMPRYYALFLNQNGHTALKERAVREALLHATNRTGIIEEVFNGHGTPAFGPLHPQMKGYDASVYADDTFSLLAARMALEEAGWVVGSDGIRSKKTRDESVTLSFTVIVPDIPFLQSIVEYLARDWRAVGVELKPVLMDPEEIVRETIKTRNYEMILFGNILRNNPDIFSFWHSSERFAPGLNLSLYDNQKADTLLESIRRDFDETSAQASIVELQTLLHEDIPAIFLFSPRYLYAHPKNVGGLTEQLIVAPSDRFDNVASWHLKTARIFR